MKLRKPEWSLVRKHGWCPHHDDQNYFKFICCESCGELLLECEQGHVFKAKIPLGKIYDESKCIYCKSKIETVVMATSEQIKKHGFDVNDYE